MAVHAKYRQPSSSERWLSCPGSVTQMQLYPNEPSEASIKGDRAHKLLELAIEWGVVPNDPDIDLVYSVMFALEWVNNQAKEYGKGVELYTEQQLEIPETGEVGTTDIIFVGKDFIHVIDYKNGYVPVDVKMHPQMMLYLCGAIAKWGERKHYKISIIQPNYVHVDGMVRHYEVTQDDLTWFRGEVQHAISNDYLAAGKHCKKTYCPHRGSCQVFATWAPENLQLAWFPGELNGMTDDQLAEALDHADILQGWRDALRGEALRRMLHQDRKIDGYKLVKARKDRDFRSPEHRDRVFDNLREFGVSEDQLYAKSPISVAGVERVIKGIFKTQGRNAWRKGMDTLCPDDMLSTATQSLTVEKAIDGRKPYSRGAEFTPLKSPEDVTSNTDALKDII